MKGLKFRTREMTLEKAAGTVAGTDVTIERPNGTKASRAERSREREREIREKREADGPCHCHLPSSLHRLVVHSTRRQSKSFFKILFYRVSRQSPRSNASFGPFYRLLLDFTFFLPSSRFLLRFTGFHWALPSFLRFRWFLLGFTGFYRVCLGFT